MALAVVTLVASFARFKVPMAVFSEERTPSRPFCRWDSSAMVETVKNPQAVRKGPRLIEMGVSRASCNRTHSVNLHSWSWHLKLKDASGHPLKVNVKY